MIRIYIISKKKKKTIVACYLHTYLLSEKVKGRQINKFRALWVNKLAAKFFLALVVVLASETYYPMFPNSDPRRKWDNLPDVHDNFL